VPFSLRSRGLNYGQDKLFFNLLKGTDLPANLLEKGLIANLFKKGLIENC
jgi:hypothetical protein